MASHGVILGDWRWFVMGSVRIFQDDFTSCAPSSLYLSTFQYLLLRLFATSLLPIPDPRSPIPDANGCKAAGAGAAIHIQIGNG